MMSAGRVLRVAVAPWALLLAALFSSVVAHAQGDAVALMLANGHIQSPYINEYLDELKLDRPVDPALARAIGWRWNTREELNALAREFPCVSMITTNMAAASFSSACSMWRATGASP